MIKKLQHKFILITMCSLILVTILIIGFINIMNIYHMNKRANIILKIISQNDGCFPKLEEFSNNFLPEFMFEMTPETPFETRYFTVKINNQGDIFNININHIASVSEKKAKAYCEEVLKNNKIRGYKLSYKYMITEKRYGKLVVFIDCQSKFRTLITFLLISYSIAIISLLLVFTLITIFSKKAIKPVIENIEKQKQFITDAGHEIKTPLAIISANSDVLELNFGKNDWIDSIRNQTSRLNELVKNLLILAKMDEGKDKPIFLDFPISDVVSEVIDTFNALAKAQDKTIEAKIDPLLSFYGDENKIRQLVSLLIDNAIKYSIDHSIIKVSLYKSGKLIKLDVTNTIDKIPHQNLNKLFDRFYRADSSRSRETGGYGIGLSIAKAIVQLHKGKIYAYYKDGKNIVFSVIL